MPTSRKQNTDGPHEPALRRSTRSSTKRTGVADNTLKGTTAAKRECYGQIITNYFTHRSSETRKRKGPNELTEQANKRVHIQTRVPVEGYNDGEARSEVTNDRGAPSEVTDGGEAPSKVTNTPEQGKLLFRVNRSVPHCEWS